MSHLARTACLQQVGVPWLMVREAPRFRPASALLPRAFRPKAPSPSPHALGEPLPFLAHSGELFTPDEVAQLRVSDRRAGERPLISRPSRLQVLRSERTPGLLAGSPARSEQCLLDAPGAEARLSRADSIVSLGDPADAERSRGMVRSQAGGAAQAAAGESYASPPVTVADLRRSVWEYARALSGAGDNGRAAQYPGALVGRRSVPAESRGRRRLTAAIRNNPHADDGAAAARQAPAKLLTDACYGARLLRDFMEDRHVPRPDFLEQPIVRSDRNRRRSGV
jgi:hypothetical protein